MISPVEDITEELRNRAFLSVHQDGIRSVIKISNIDHYVRSINNTSMEEFRFCIGKKKYCCRGSRAKFCEAIPRPCP